MLRHCELKLAIAIEVADGDVIRICAHRKAGGGAEGARACPEQDRNVSGTEVRHRQIELAIAIEVSHADRIGICAGSEVARRRKAWLVALRRNTRRGFEVRRRILS